MNWNLPLVACAILATIGLSGCVSPPDGPVINNPTVDEMNQLDAQMGLKPRSASPTTPAVPTPGVYVPDVPAPAPAPAPAPGPSA